MELEEKIKRYYKSFYFEELGLKDWESRVATRLKEEELFARPVVTKLERALNYNFQDQKVLVVGAGTGAEFIELHNRGAEVYGIEPNPFGFEILMEKCRLNGVPQDRIKKGVAESLPYEDNSFDFVYCYTVLEHVQSVKTSLNSMLRTLRVGGRLFIETPNYRMPYEPHYKIMVPTFLPRFIQKFYLRLHGRPTQFINSLNYINRRILLDYMRHLPVMTIQILDDYPEHFCKWTNPMYLFMRVFGIERDFWFVFQKLSERRR